ncbi:MAG: phosphatidate cytidylyltransferase, partial [Thermomicrobiales bacterium]
MLNALRDPELLWLFGGVLAVLVVASAIGTALARTVTSAASRAVIDNLNARTRSWWVMCAVFALTLLVGKTGSLILFGFLSFL